MFRIAVCDDEAVQRQHIDALLEKYFSMHPGYPVQRSLFSDGNELIAAVKSGESFQLYILDILMPKLDGIRTGVALRELGLEEDILFLTTSSDYGIESYQARAADYLLKPVDQVRLFSDLDRILQQHARRRQEQILVNTSSGIRQLPINQILYAERMERAVVYRCIDGQRIKSRTLQGSFEEGVRPLLAYKQFFLCGSSFLFNLDHITSVERALAIFNHGLQVPIPRTQASALRAAWCRYWIGGGKDDI